MAQAKKPAATPAAKKTAPAPAAVEETVAAPVAAPAPVDTWVIKDRLYEITSGRKPLAFTLPTVHSARTPLLYFDEELGYNRELRYATNQRTPFVDEQQGTATLGRIVFRDGILRVPKENIVLQKLLSLYHPYTLQGRIMEYKPEQIAAHETDWIELELEAMTVAK